MRTGFRKVFNVKSRYSKRSRKNQPHFERVVVVHRPATRAGMHLTRRYRIHPSIADLLASLAGLGQERAR